MGCGPNSPSHPLRKCFSELCKGAEMCWLGNDAHCRVGLNFTGFSTDKFHLLLAARLLAKANITVVSC